MAHYIDKDTLVTELKTELRKYKDNGDDYWFPVINELKYVTSLIDNLEVKEEDLEKEIKTIWNKDFSGHFDVIGYTDFTEIAKHFFELGLKAQKEIKYKGESK